MRRATDFFSLLQVAWPLLIIWTKFTEKAPWSDPNLFFQVPCRKCVISYLSFFWKAPRIMRQRGLGISWTLLTNNSNGSSSCIVLAVESIATPSDTASIKLKKNLPVRSSRCPFITTVSYYSPIRVLIPTSTAMVPFTILVPVIAQGYEPATFKTSWMYHLLIKEMFIILDVVSIVTCILLQTWQQTWSSLKSAHSLMSL